MNALHYATFFDCREVVEFLAKHNPCKRLDRKKERGGGEREKERGREREKERGRERERERELLCHLRA